jgi:hypothetical protein
LPLRSFFRTSFDAAVYGKSSAPASLGVRQDVGDDEDDDESIYCPSQLASYADIHGLYHNIAILE